MSYISNNLLIKFIKELDRPHVFFYQAVKQSSNEISTGNELCATYAIGAAYNEGMDERDRLKRKLDNIYQAEQKLECFNNIHVYIYLILLVFNQIR